MDIWVGNAKYWTQTLPAGRGQSRKYRFFNPMMQNEGHIKWLRAAIGDPSIPIYSYIVFGNRCVLKKITQSTNLHHVLNRSEVLFHVQENAFEKGIRLLPEQIDALYEKLLPFAQISPELKEMHNEDVRKKQAGDLYHFGK